MSHILSVAPAVPGPALPQAQITATIAPLLLGEEDGGNAAAGTSPASSRRRTLDRLHGASGVQTRHLALPLDAYGSLTSFGQANDHFIHLGTQLAEEAARSALDLAGLQAHEVDFLMFTSVTGVSAPSLDALLVARLGMRTDVRRLPSFGLGCVAGAAGLARVHDYLEGHPGHVALLVSVELCSLTIQHGDDSMANLVSSGLFGDGAAAVVMVGDAHPAAGRAQLAVVDSRSRLYPDTEDHLGWHVGDSGFRIVLSAGLAGVVGEHLGDDVAGLLEDHDLKARDVARWVVHAGGPRILEAVQEALDLDDVALEHSRASLAAVGNLSSASVLHVLDATMREGAPPGSPGVLLAFGPGVSAEIVLLRWAGEA